MARRRHTSLGASDADHAAVGKRHIEQAWDDLERMPPTCRGGIDVAGRALASASRGMAHMQAIEDKRTREFNNEIFGLGNRAVFAAGKTLDFFAGVCQAPGGEARERPMFNRRGDAQPRKKKELHGARRRR